MKRLSETELAVVLHQLRSEGDATRRSMALRLAAYPGLQELAASWDEALAGLGLTAEPTDPPAGLLDAIEARIDRDPMPMTRTARADDGGWRQRTPGIWIRMLNEDPGSGAITYLLRCEPGAVVPPHDHPRDEELFVLEGEVEFDAMTLRAGDFQASPAGSSHPRSTTGGGCLLLVRLG